MISLINHDSRARENSEVVMKFTQIDISYIYRRYFTIEIIYGYIYRYIYSISIDFMNVSFHCINNKKGESFIKMLSSGSIRWFRQVRQGTLICSRKSSSGLRGFRENHDLIFFSGIPMTSFDVRRISPIFITKKKKIVSKWIGNGPPCDEIAGKTTWYQTIGLPSGKLT